MAFDFDERIDRNGTACIKYDAMESFLGVAGAIPMWVADMDFRTPGFILEALGQKLQQGVLGYPFREKSFASSLKDWLLRRHQWAIDEKEVLFTPGVVPAINLAVLALTAPGDKIIVQPPVYFPFFSAVTDHGRQLLYNPLTEQGGRLCMDIPHLEKLAAQGAKMIILSSPHNPGGSVWTRDELQAVGDICLKYNLLILSDEIHCDLVYPGYKHLPVAGFSEAVSQITLTFVAPSKTFNLSGLSTAAVIIANEQLRKSFEQQMEHLHLGLGNLFGNAAFEAAYRQGDRWVDELMLYLNGNLNELETLLNAHLPTIRMLRPEATFLVWLDCRALKMDDKTLNHFFLQKAGVGLNPGFMFGPGGEGFMRMNIGCPRSTLQQAVDQIAKALTAIGS